MLTIAQQIAARSPIVSDLTRDTFANLSVVAGCAYLREIVTPTVAGGLFALPAPVVIGTAADAAARDLGFTRSVQIEGGDMGGDFLIQPDTDLDGRYRAWGVDWQEWTWVNGWNVLVEEVVA